MHRAANHIIADVTGAGEEVTQVAGVHSPHSGDGVAFDTGDLHQAADGVTGQTQMVFHRHLSGVLNLIQILSVNLCKGGSGHRTGSADLCLAATFCAGNGGVALCKAANDTGGGKATENLLVREAARVLRVLQNCR